MGNAAGKKLRIFYRSEMNNAKCWRTDSRVWFPAKRVSYGMIANPADVIRQESLTEEKELTDMKR
jgi:hypothetical protein